MINATNITVEIDTDVKNPSLSNSYPNTTTSLDSLSASKAASSAVNRITFFDFASNSLANASHRQNASTTILKRRAKWCGERGGAMVQAH
mmetsp:Transcript_15651/g.33895  ORF Transcript_15651/g.33895 Transcript_15651/m.33895 type:complete len:90 (-) Transcript_15651:4-273(-)